MQTVGLYHTTTYPHRHTRCKQILNKGKLQTIPSEGTMVTTNSGVVKGNTKISRSQQAWKMWKIRKINDTILKGIQSNSSIKTRKGQRLTTQRCHTKNQLATLEKESSEVQFRGRSGSHDRTPRKNGARPAHQKGTSTYLAAQNSQSTFLEGQM